MIGVMKEILILILSLFWIASLCFVFFSQTLGLIWFPKLFWDDVTYEITIGKEINTTPLKIILRTIILHYTTSTSLYFGQLALIEINTTPLKLHLIRRKFDCEAQVEFYIHNDPTRTTFIRVLLYILTNLCRQ